MDVIICLSIKDATKVLILNYKDNLMAEEIWKSIVGYEEIYAVSSLGRVKNLTRGKIRKLGDNTRGYLRVNLSKNGQSKFFSVHRLVATAFIPNPDRLPQVNHRNGVKTDNRVENLEWVDISKNQKHSYKVLKRKSPKSELDSNQVLEIDRLLRQSKSTTEQIAQAYGVSRRIIINIETGKNYQYLTERDRQPRRQGSSLTIKQVIEIKKLLLSENCPTLTTIGKTYGVSYQAISNIKLGKRWGDVKISDY
ncbi:MAG: NUMOD4 domain-containing protein [Cyanobacteria bacterium J06555_3]